MSGVMEGPMGSSGGGLRSGVPDGRPEGGQPCARPLVLRPGGKAVFRQDHVCAAGTGRSDRRVPATEARTTNAPASISGVTCSPSASQPMTIATTGLT
jgi:hypothetical protein